MPHALIVEDDAHIRDLIVLHLGLEGLQTSAVGDGRDALELLGANPYDLVVLDLMLPGVDGISICRAIRRGGPNHDVPVLMLTARREESDKVLGLESGADDYLAKPFGMREMVARVRALLRRPRASQLATAAAGRRAPAPERPVHCAASRSIRTPRQSRRGVELTQEFRLYSGFIRIVFSREALLSRVWPDHTYVTLRSVDTLVKRLRRRIEATPAEPTLILTIWGSGYKFADV
jgi:DNA-binding response OmpR family regulator